LPAIIVVSSQNYSGKSSVVVGLALEFRDRGFKVGYMKPVGAFPIKVENEKVDEDAYFARGVLGLSDSLSDISPYFLNRDTLVRYMRKKPENPLVRVEASYNKLSKGKDLMFLEGARNFLHGRMLNLSALEVAGALQAKVLLLDTFDEELTVDRVLSASDFFGKLFLGVVLNWVPPRRMEFTRNRFGRYMKSNGVNMFGSIPVDNALRSITVNDLADGLDGKIVSARDKGDELIESMMVGAMGQEQALRLFRKQANKVVVTGGDRSDIQLAALETPTKSLVLTGGHMPDSRVLNHAEEIGVPVILVDYDTATTVEMVDAVIGRQKVHNLEKIERMRGFIREGLDLDLMLEQIGIEARG